jgi:signal transduction histidine kinase
VKPWSLRSRLLIFATIGIAVVLGVAGLSFSLLYQRHVEKFVMADLTIHLEQLLGNVTLTPEGQVEVGAELSDPRFEQPGGGLYWQIDIPGQTPLRSRSLWDQVLTVPTPPDSAEEDHAHVMALPSGGEIFALEKKIIVTSDAGAEKATVVTVGIDRNRVTNPVSEFLRALLFGLAAMSLALLGSMLAMLSFGLKPLQAVKQGVAALRAGAENIDTQQLPAEIVPLAQEVNELVSARERQLERARQRASNLAHGLKTPLAVMQSIANELRGKGNSDAAESIELNSGQMRDLVHRELTRSRIAASHHSSQTEFAPVLSKVVATMKKAQRGDALIWNIALPETLHVRVETVDLTELLGNLLDNARKHATEMVRISHNGETLTIEDDGFGVDDVQLPQILKRGVRLDEKLPGSGIGLAIVSDLAEVYGLTLAVRRSDLGGLAIDIGLPEV